MIKPLTHVIDRVDALLLASRECRQAQKAYREAVALEPHFNGMNGPRRSYPLSQHEVYHEQEDDAQKHSSAEAKHG